MFVILLSSNIALIFQLDFSQAPYEHSNFEKIREIWKLVYLWRIFSHFRIQKLIDFFDNTIKKMSKFESSAMKNLTINMSHHFEEIVKKIEWNRKMKGQNNDLCTTKSMKSNFRFFYFAENLLYLTSFRPNWRK